MDGLQSKTAGRTGLSYPFGESVPETGKVREIAPGIYWVRMPLPMKGLAFINLWLIDDGPRGWTIVDTGLPTDEVREAWSEVFDSVLEGRPVWRILITHMHPDHIGTAGWITRKYPDCELWITRLEYVTCRMLVADTGRDAPQAGIDFYRAAGWDEELIDNYKRRFGGFGKGVTQLPDGFQRLEDGDLIELGGAQWRVVVGNGHSPEHACLYCEQLNLFISGDQLLPRISSNVSVHPTEPKANPLKDWLDSCAKLQGVIDDDVLVLPAHNFPFKGGHARLQHLIDGHNIALKRLKQRLGQEKRRVVDVFPSVFGRKIGRDLVSMATGEALAHLNYLVAAGEARCEADETGVNWYTA